MGFDREHGTVLYAMTTQNNVDIPSRVSLRLFQAGKSTPTLFRRENAAVASIKQRIVDEGIAETNRFLDNVETSIDGMTILHPSRYADFFRQEATQMLRNNPNIDARTRSEANRDINQYVRRIQQLATTTEWHGGGNYYIQLLRNFNILLQEGFDRIRRIRTSVNPLFNALPSRPIPRGSTDNLTAEEINKGDIMGDFQGRYNEGLFHKQSTIDKIERNDRGQLISPYDRAIIDGQIENYIADVAATGGGIKCPICKKMVGKKH